MLGSLWFNSFSAGGGGAAGDFELISTTLITTNTASVTFASLNTTAAAYKHLQLRITDRSSASVNSQVGIRFNGDSGANYYEHLMNGGGSGSPTTYGGGGVTFAPMGSGSESGATASSFSARIIDIPDFSQTTKAKLIREHYGMASSANKIGMFSAAWYSTSAVTSMEVFMNAGNFVDGSRLSLYGLKG